MKLYNFKYDSQDLHINMTANPVSKLSWKLYVGYHFAYLNENFELLYLLLNMKITKIVKFYDFKHGRHRYLNHPSCKTFVVMTRDFQRMSAEVHVAYNIIITLLQFQLHIWLVELIKKQKAPGNGQMVHHLPLQTGDQDNQIIS